MLGEMESVSGRTNSRSGRERVAIQGEGAEVGVGVGGGRSVEAAAVDVEGPKAVLANGEGSVEVVAVAVGWSEVGEESSTEVLPDEGGLVEVVDEVEESEM